MIFIKKLISTALSAALMAAASSCSADVNVNEIPDAPEGFVDRVEPPCWWVGMKTGLQLFIKGPEISCCEVSFVGLNGVKVTAVTKAESPNYLFVDLNIADDAECGTGWLVFTKKDSLQEFSFKFPYEISARREGSAQRESFGTGDAIYLIMPDRFCNADKLNDNSPLTSEPADADAFFGRHGGDIDGIRSHLDYIADLGMTAIWCTPLLEDNEPRESYHGYACTDYYKIDLRFGSNEDYRSLVSDAHSRGLKMIMDIVTNHCGDAHWWMKDLPFTDWIHQWDSYTHSNCAFSVHNDSYCSQHDRACMEAGWFDTSMVDMNLDNPFLLQYFKQWGIWWIEWADLDGFRVDTYPYNEKEPMSQWCKAIRTEYPSFNIVGEVWCTNVPQTAYWQTGNSNKDGFDSNLPTIMDFSLLDAVCGSLNTSEEHWNEGITKVYESIANDVFYANPEAMMIFPGNHDTPRIADMAQGDPSKVKEAMALMATLRGFPQIFAGDEIFARSRDLTQGHGGLRVEFNDNWRNDPVAADLHDYCRKLFQWRRTSEAVQHGKTLHFLSRSNTYAYFRYTGEQCVFVFINNNDSPVRVPWGDYEEITGSLAQDGMDVISGVQIRPSEAVVPAKSALVVDFR